MNKNNNETSVTLKRTKPRYIVIRENIHAALDIYSMSLYMAFRYESDYTSEDSIIKRSAKFLYEKAKISRRQFFRCLNILEDLGLILRDSESPLNSVSTYHVAQELNYFNTDCVVVPDMHGVVPDRHTDHYSLSLSSNINITTNSESDDSAVAAIQEKKSKAKPNIELRKLIEIYAHHFPNNPQPHARVIATSLEKALRGLIKRWPEADPKNSPMTYEAFEIYMHGLKTLSPKFSLGEYVTSNGNKKKNNLETFCRWNTFVKFLQDDYS